MRRLMEGVGIFVANKVWYPPFRFPTPLSRPLAQHVTPSRLFFSVPCVPRFVCFGIWADRSSKCFLRGPRRLGGSETACADI